MDMVREQKALRGSIAGPMTRDYTPFVFSSFVGFVLLFALTVPIDEWAGAFVYLVIIAMGGVLLYRRGLQLVEPAFPAALFVLALMTKLVASIVRYWTIVSLYHGFGDAFAYYTEALRLVPYFRTLDFSITNWYAYGPSGSTNVVYITTVLYTLLPASFMGSFFLFAALAFGGSVLFYLAARVVAPGRPINVYFWLIFFSPSVLFWPSSLGKDALIFFGSGLVAWGWAYFVRRGRIWGIIFALLGLLLIALIRPHIGLLLILAMGAAYLLYGMRNTRHLGLWLIGLIVIGVMAIRLLPIALAYVKIDQLSYTDVADAYTYRQDITGKGSSGYTPPNMLNPAGAVYGVITVLFRPFPWEAHNGQSLLSAVEAVAWMLLFWLKRRQVLSHLNRARKEPWSAFLLSYTLLMIFAMTSLSNFGILARERVMMLPFTWMLLL